MGGQLVLPPSWEQNKGQFRDNPNRNPSGYSGLYGEVKRLCREYSPQGTMRLIEIVEDRTADDRARIVAYQTLMAYGWGKPTEQPAAQVAKVRPNMDAISDEELATMERIFEKMLGPEGVLQDDPAEAGQEAGMDAPEPE